ncbi:MAG: RNA pseudouridine synthase [Agathobacter sp.]|nr:RNA pseudouridine synthase [Agathobacter sp.]
MIKPLEVIYEDADILLVYKTAGIATQTKNIAQPDMERTIKNYRAQKKEPISVGVVHRLDQPGEGLMVFAKTQKAAASLSKQVQGRMIGKHYYAVSQGKPKAATGQLKNLLLTDKKANVTKVVEDKAAFPDAKEAILDYTVIKEQEGYTLLDICLGTGRQHQIRVQLANIGCPIVGDLKYGPMVEGSISRGKFPALCSYRLQFVHPTTGKEMDVSIMPKGEAFQIFQ